MSKFGAINQIMTCGMDSDHKFDSSVELAVVFPFCPALERLLEERRLHDLQRIDPLKGGNGSGGYILRRSAIGS